MSGVGEKTAQKLIAQYGSIENLLSHSAELKGALKTKVETNRKMIEFSKFLATIKIDVPIALNMDELKREEPNEEELRKIFEEMEFRTLIDRVFNRDKKSAFAGTYPDKVAAAMALCGGSTLKDVSGLGGLPLWIMHGTADRAVPIKQSKTVVEQLQKSGNDKRLRYDWLKGASHGALARILYMTKTYDWLFSHSLNDKDRPVNKEIDIDKEDLSKAYKDMISGAPDPEVVYDKTIY